MIGPGGYADLEMDDVALEGAPASAAPSVHWSQQHSGFVGVTATLAPTGGAGLHTGVCFLYPAGLELGCPHHH